MEELKPCPFCGSKAKKYTWFFNYSTTYHQVFCPNEQCPIKPMTEWDTDETKAVNDWNRRADDGT